LLPIAPEGAKSKQKWFSLYVHNDET